MGAAAGPVGAIASIGGAGLGAWGTIVQGVAAGDNFKAASLENAAQRGRVAAVQTGATASEKIASDLANIDGVRAAARADPTPGAAVRDWNGTLGLTKKSIDVDNIIAQSNQEASDAAYMRSAAKTALLSGEISAGAGLLGGIGQGLSGLGGGAPSSMPKGYTIQIRSAGCTKRTEKSPAEARP
jgi:hypothetical protein